MVRLTTSAHHQNLLSAIQALDIEKTRYCLEQYNCKGWLWIEGEVFSQLWRAEQQETGNKEERKEKVIALLNLLCEAGVNPLSDTQMALTPYIADWARQRDTWKTLEGLVLQHGFKTPHGGGWVHALCENGAFNLRAILNILSRQGYPNEANVGASSFWTARDDRGLAPIEVLWLAGGWEDRGPWAQDADQPPGETALRITQWCQKQGLSLYKDTPHLMEGMQTAAETRAFQNGTIRTQLLEFMTQWKRNTLLDGLPSRGAIDDPARAL